MRESCVRYFGDTHRRPIDATVKRYDYLKVTDTFRGIERPWKPWLETIINDLKALNLTIKIALNLSNWNCKINVAAHS